MRVDFFGLFPGFLEHFVGHVYTDDVAGFTNGSGSEKAVESSAAAEVEYGFAGF